jgi:hypothetical protein
VFFQFQKSISAQLHNPINQSFHNMNFSKKSIFFAFLILLNTGFVLAQAAQTPIEVADLTLKIGSKDEQTVHYAFAEGDRVYFSFAEADKKSLREISVTEYPDNLKYKSVDTEAAADKQFYVQRKGVYSFTFKNNAFLASRNVKVNIRRVPASATTKNFDTGVQWQTKRDTTFEYGSDWELKEFSRTEKQLVRTDTQIVTLFDKTERLDGKFVYNGKTENNLTFKLPPSKYSPDAKNPYNSTELVSWAYWIGVGTESAKGYNDQNKKLVGVASSAAKLAGPYGAIAGLAIDGVSMLTMSSPLGDNVDYMVHVVDKNKKAVLVDKGNGTTASAKNATHLQGDVVVKLYNDNLREGIDVTVKAVAVIVTKVYEDRTILTNQYVAKNKNAVKKAIVKETQVPLMR